MNVDKCPNCNTWNPPACTNSETIVDIANKSHSNVFAIGLHIMAFERSKAHFFSDFLFSSLFFLLGSFFKCLVINRLFRDDNITIEKSSALFYCHVSFSWSAIVSLDKEQMSSYQLFFLFQGQWCGQINLPRSMKRGIYPHITPSTSFKTTFLCAKPLGVEITLPIVTL